MANEIERYIDDVKSRLESLRSQAEQRYESNNQLFMGLRAGLEGKDHDFVTQMDTALRMYTEIPKYIKRAEDLLDAYASRL